MSQTDTVLKTYFETGDRPTQGQFQSLIESKANVGTEEAQQVKGVYYVSTSASITNHGDAAVTGSIQWCIATAGGAPIVLPPGDFPVTGTSSIVLDTETILLGAGVSTIYSASNTYKASRIVKTGTGPAIKLNPAYASMFKGLRLKGIEIIASATDAATGDGLDLSATYGVRDSSFEDLAIWKAGRDGITGDFPNGATGFFFVNNSFRDVRIGDISTAADKPVRDGIRLTGRIAECVFTNVRVYAKGYAWYLADSASDVNGLHQNNAWYSCSVSGNADSDSVYLKNQLGGGWFGGHIERATGSGKAGLVLDGGTANVGGFAVSGGFFEGNSQHIRLASTNVDGISAVSNMFWWNGTVPASAPTIIQTAAATQSVAFWGNRLYSAAGAQTLSNNLQSIVGQTASSESAITTPIIRSHTNSPILIDGPVSGGGTDYQSVRFRTYNAAGTSLVERATISSKTDASIFRLLNGTRLAGPSNAPLLLDNMATTADYDGIRMRSLDTAGTTQLARLTVEGGRDIAKVNVTNAGLGIDTIASAPQLPTQDNEATIYVKGGLLVIAYNHGGTVKYRTLSLTDVAATWSYTTTPP